MTPGALPAEAATAQHCVIKVKGTDAKGNFIIESTTCYDSYAQVLRSQGAKNVSDSITPQIVQSSQLMLLGIIATHYDGVNSSGASVSVEGADCNGGGLQLPASWNDRISSTSNGCPIITHYEHTNYGGNIATTVTPGGNIAGYMNNKTSSIKYFT